jgi:multidrug transporter EmrE-like cation transporter
MNIKIFPLLLLGVLFNALAQLLLKEGMSRIGYFAFSFENLIPISAQVATNVFILLGLLSYVGSLVLWLLVLSRVPVSYAYPMLSIGYIINLVAAHYWFQEEVSFNKVMGILIIIGGVYLLSRQ